MDKYLRFFGVEIEDVIAAKGRPVNRGFFALIAGDLPLIRQGYELARSMGELDQFRQAAAAAGFDLNLWLVEE